MHRLFVTLSVAALTIGCNPDEPCQRYVDYMCECHDDDPGFDCAELERTYEKADAEVQNSCAIELRSQRADDEAEGLECEA